MAAFETVKQTLEAITGFEKPNDPEAAAALRIVKPQSFVFSPAATVPNNPRLPLLIYPDAVDLSGGFDPAAVFEQIFAANGWGKSWRNGIFPYQHFHPAIHEVLGIARGFARVRFGGSTGVEVEVKAGDVAVLPAGTGHQRLTMSDDLLVVGAYPPDGTYEECRGDTDDLARAKAAVAATPLPAKDPLYGSNGPLKDLWRY